MAKLNKNEAEFIHKAEALSSCILLGQSERRRRRKYQAQRGRKQKMSPQPAKVRTIMSANPGSRRCQPAAKSGHYHRILWRQQEMKSTSIQGWLNLMPYCPPWPLELWFQPSFTRKLHCQMQQNWPSSSMEQRLYLAPSCWAKAGEEEEEENIRLKKEGSRQKMSLQPAKVRTKIPAKPGGRRCQAAALSGHCHWELWNQQEMKSTKIFRVGSISCLIAHHHH